MSLEVTCVYRDADPLTLNLLDLESFCGAGRRLAFRRLEDSGFGMEVRLLGDAAEQVSAAALQALSGIEVVIESGLIPGDKFQKRVTCVAFSIKLARTH